VEDRVSKRIVLCFDGTWNVGGPRSSNVWRLYEALESAHNSQTKYYHGGIGSHNSGMIGFPAKLVTGTTGLTISGSIKNGYSYLVDRFSPGDSVYMFGFSRGAFAVRSLAGLIYSCGLLRAEEANRKSQAFRTYRIGNLNEEQEFRERFCHPHCHIAMIGVWDTVASLGLPVNWLERMNPLPSQFHRTDLNPLIKSAYHALAVDENRKAFLPTLFSEESRLPGQVLEQVWFPGCHSDVGGGYRQRGLADIALDWMIQNAERNGLCFRASKPLAADNAHEDKIRNPRKGWRCFFVRADRLIPLSKTTKISVSVQQRATAQSVLPKYSPTNICEPWALERHYTAINSSTSNL
jgi:uncharacterized protein (DUF2235 family)